MIASGLSSALPVASGLFAGAGPLANAGLGPVSAPAVGELDGVLSAGVVPDVVGVVDTELGGVLDAVVDGLPVDDGEPGAVFDAVGEQLGVVGPVDPLLLPWPDGAVLPPPLALG